jgi:phosphatidate cytidylyltransferase
VISSVVGLVLLGLVVWFGELVFGMAVFLLALVGMHEFYNSLSKGGYRPVKAVGYMSCLLILFIGLYGKIEPIAEIVKEFRYASNFFFFIFVIFILLFLLIIFSYERYNLSDISLTLFGIFYIAFSFSFLVMTRNLDNGFYYIWLAFIGAWGTDTAAFFTGMGLGKKKILPVISPKKTLEGAIGGVAGCVLLTVLYGLFLNYNHFIGYTPLYHFVILGALNGFISQIGDWGASAVKRYVNIKDYGNIMPGHGGVLDRFDSILFVSPLVYYYIRFIISAA